MTPSEQALFSRKIKTPAELREILGPPPRENRVIMCHGTFDLVHPGHIRHLIYAKSKASILIASLTSDLHINKGDYRPFVPQELRAMNLAALEVVDYVVIDPNSTPIENLKIIQPDYFAKGYEYSEGGLHPKTREELETIETYGGELIFTPGDIVYSSSAIIESTRPRMPYSKLHALMAGEGISFDRLRQVVKSLAGTKVHVGIVAKHMTKANADVKFTTVLGDDALKDYVLTDLRDYGVECDAVIDPTRPTTRKNLFIAGDYRMVKVDTVDNRSISHKILEHFCSSTASTKSDAVVFSDFRHGVFNSSTTSQLTAAIPKGPLRIADSQVATRWGNILDFQGFDLITPNEREARFAMGDQDSIIRPLALNLYCQAKCRYLILKLGERGIITYRAPDPNVRSFFTVDTFADHVVDAVGAGDALLAYSTLALVASGCPVIASILGSVAAALACEQDGNTPIDPDALLARLDRVERNAEMKEHYLVRKTATT
jgi:cytidyltransferase-like protein